MRAIRLFDSATALCVVAVNVIRPESAAVTGLGNLRASGLLHE